MCGKQPVQMTGCPTPTLLKTITSLSSILSHTHVCLTRSKNVLTVLVLMQRMTDAEDEKSEKTQLQPSGYTVGNKGNCSILTTFYCRKFPASFLGC